MFPKDSPFPKDSNLQFTTIQSQRQDSMADDEMPKIINSSQPLFPSIGTKSTTKKELKK
jgi:hypothetical protein